VSGASITIELPQTFPGTAVAVNFGYVTSLHVPGVESTHSVEPAK
jgi:hypothetical protein